MLRPATPADLDAVHSIYMHPDVVPFLGYDPMALEDFRPVFQELVDCGSFYVLEREGVLWDSAGPHVNLFAIQRRISRGAGIELIDRRSDQSYMSQAQRPPMSIARVIPCNSCDG